MKEIVEPAYAKLNLCLDVLGLCPNGYHELVTVMHSCTLHDDVHVRLTEDGVFRAKSNRSYIPDDERNVAARAARVYLESVGLEGFGADIYIHKRIPVGAGMGGGSSDAAAVLRALDKLTGKALGEERLRELCGEVGSDVPFCIVGGAALARGRGEILEPLPAMTGCPLVICKPQFSLSTPELFRRVDARTASIRPDTSGLVRSLCEGDVSGVARRLFNVFEDVLPRRCGEIAVIKSRLLDLGALGVVMTGTGSAVFGIFPSSRAAEDACRVLSERYADCFAAEAGERL